MNSSLQAFDITQLPPAAIMFVDTMKTNGDKLLSGAASLEELIGLVAYTLPSINFNNAQVTWLFNKWYGPYFTSKKSEEM